MSIFPGYQPIQFEQYLPNECRAELYEFMSLAEQTDYATFQVQLEPCEGVENVILDPTFAVPELGPWTPSGGFSLITGDACKADDGSTGTVIQPDIFVIGQAYQLQIVVASLVGTFQVYNGATLLANVSYVGLNTINFIAVHEDLTISFDNGEAYGCISSANAYPFSPNMAFGIIDENGDTAFVADFASNPSYFTFVGNTVTIRFTWSDIGLSPGCYRIGFADGCDNTNAQFGVFNQSLLNGDLGWDSDVNTLQAINFNVAGEDTYVEFTALGANETGSITNNVTELTIGLCYRITIADASSDADGFIRFYCGTAFFDLDMTIGIYPTSFDITCAGNGDFKIEPHMETATNIKIGLGMTVGLCDQADYVFDYMSQSFKLAHDHPCTHLIQVTCEEDSLDWAYVGTGFEPSVRLISEIYNSQPEELREHYFSNSGTKQVYYGEYRKHFFFVVEMMPAWLFDFFCNARIADHFYIDGTDYFMEGDALSPEYADGITNFLTFRTEISVKTQMSRNANINNPICEDTEVMDFICTDLMNVDTGLTDIQRDFLFAIQDTKTGQTTSYETGDDGDREDGRGFSFLALTCNNWFGNQNRFTDETGAQTYTNDLVLDWQYQLMWYRLPFGTVATWTLAVSGAEGQTTAGYTDWRLPNIKQLESLVNYGMSDTMNYAPLNISSTPYANIWSSTTNPNATTEAYRINPVNGNVNGLAKATAGVYYVICRPFTKEDLGL